MFSKKILSLHRLVTLVESDSSLFTIAAGKRVSLLQAAAKLVSVFILSGYEEQLDFLCSFTVMTDFNFTDGKTMYFSSTCSAQMHATSLGDVWKLQECGSAMWFELFVAAAGEH